MPITSVDGIPTRYEILGNGPPLLMFSPGGFNATLDTWSSLGAYAITKPLEHLTQAHTCIVFDRRETGQSGGRVERIGWHDYVAQGKGLLDQLNIRQAHLMGGCMGCSPVLSFAVSHPDTVLSMILYWAGRRRPLPYQQPTPLHGSPGLRAPTRVTGGRGTGY